MRRRRARSGRSPLGVAVPILGEVSETFIQRHVRGLDPRATVFVGGVADGATWSTPDEQVSFLRPGAMERMKIRCALTTEARRRRHLRWLEERFSSRLQVDASLLVEYLDFAVELMTTIELAHRVVIHGHGYDISERAVSSMARTTIDTLNTASAIVVPSERAASLLKSRGVREVHVIPYGVDVPREPRPREVVREFLAVGRLVGKKDPVATVKAFLAARRVEPGLRLTIIGDGPLRTSLDEVLRADPLGCCVSLLGAQPHHVVLQLMERSDAFLQHSRIDPQTGDEEGVPVAILEAMARGLPVVATRHGGIPDAVVDGETGVLVREGDLEGMTAAMLELSRTPARAQSMGSAGWRRAQERFNWSLERQHLRQLLHLPPE